MRPKYQLFTDAVYITQKYFQTRQESSDFNKNRDHKAGFHSNFDWSIKFIFWTGFAIFYYNAPYEVYNANFGKNLVFIRPKYQLFTEAVYTTQKYFRTQQKNEILTNIELSKLDLAVTLTYLKGQIFK